MCRCWIYEKMARPDSGHLYQTTHQWGGSPVWLLEPLGIYSVRSFYNMINWGGVSTPLWKKFWKIVVPNIYLVFVWLAFNNKVLTWDNLNKRRVVENLNCLFCNENESVHHLFFECVVAKQIWIDVVEVFGFNIPKNMIELSSFWEINNKKTVINIACVAAIWGIWIMHNDICFQGISWTSTRAILERINFSRHQWKILCGGDQSVLLRHCLQLLDRWRGELLRIAWVGNWERVQRGPGVETCWKLIQDDLVSKLMVVLFSEEHSVLLGWWFRFLPCVALDSRLAVSCFSFSG